MLSHTGKLSQVKQTFLLLINNLEFCNLSGNLTSETVSVQWVTPAGNGVHQLTDFKAGLTITSITVPGELDLSLPNYQVLCFLSPSTGDIIPAEAIFKLRQKHRGAGRIKIFIYRSHRTHLPLLILHYFSNSESRGRVEGKGGC